MLRTDSMESHPGQTGSWLSPYRVLDLTDRRGLLAAHMLAKLGADVIQVEPPEGSPARNAPPFHVGETGERYSLFWEAYAAGKRSVVCDLQSSDGRQDFLRLVESADFLFESSDPGTMGRIGLDWASLQKINPRLIYVSISAFGATGPKAGHAATDLTVWAAGGPLLQTREPGKMPLRISVPQAFLHGSADAACGALVAHFARLKTGRGQHVDISTQQSVAQATLSSILSAAVGHDDFSIRPQPKTGGKPPVDLSGSGARTRRSKWHVRDGLVELHLAMGPATGRFTNNLFAWMREENACDPAIAAWDWITLPARIERGELADDEIERAREQVAAFLADQTKLELITQAIRRKILLAPVATTADLANSPHYAARGFFGTSDSAAGSLTMPGPFMACGRQAVAIDAAPRLGQHTPDKLWRTEAFGVAAASRPTQPEMLG